MIIHIKKNNNGKNYKYIYLILFIFCWDNLAAQDDFSFENPILRGTGCPAGTTTIVMSPDKQEISILFDRFFAEVPQYDGVNDNNTVTIEHTQRGRRNDRILSHKVCNMIIKAFLPINHRLVGSKITIDFRGSTLIENNAKAIFRSVFLQWKGPRGKKGKRKKIHRRVWQGNLVQDDWYISLNKNTKFKTGCAKNRERKVTFKLRNIIKAVIPRNIDASIASAHIALDTSDIAGQMKLKLNMRPCGG